MKIFRILLFPVVPIYFVITWLRNWFYDVGIYKSESFNFPVIAVGNLSTGGTGKTPMVEYIIQLLKSEYNIGVLSRGYGRKTKGFLLANENATADTIGDEPYQFYNKFKESITVAVDESRKQGILELMGQNNNPNVIVLDDAFQHRKVKAGFYILLTTYGKLYSNDIVLPTGNLREPRTGAKRADVIIVTKCPKSISQQEKQEIRSKLKPLSNQHLFFSSINYSDEVFAFNKVKKLVDLQNVTLITGIANPIPLVEYIEASGIGFKHLKFNDHHNFTETEINSFEKLESILTTEKDYMRLKAYESLKNKLYYIPIDVTIKESDSFNKIVETYLKSY